MGGKKSKETAKNDPFEKISSFNQRVMDVLRDSPLSGQQLSQFTASSMSCLMKYSMNTGEGETGK